MGHHENAIRRSGGEVHLLHCVFEVAGGLGVELVALTPLVTLPGVIIRFYLRMIWWRIVFTCHNRSAGLAFEFLEGSLGDAAAGSSSLPPFRHRTDGPSFDKLRLDGGVSAVILATRHVVDPADDAGDQRARMPTGVSDAGTTPSEARVGIQADQ